MVKIFFLTFHIIPSKIFDTFCISFFRRWWIVCCFGVLAACFGVYCLVNPNVSAETIAWVVGLGIILDGIGNWVKVAVVNKVEKRFVKLHDRIREVTDIDWEEVQ